MLALFLFALDQTVVGTALPIITTKLHGQELYTWAVTIYLLTSTISGPIYGKLSDLYGRRPIFIWAVGLFLVSSVFAGLRQEMWQFILARGLRLLAVLLWGGAPGADRCVRLGLAPLRAVTISVLWMCLAGFGFVGAITLLPLSSQAVRGMAATESALNCLPLVLAPIVGA